jgi:hypothetical protein
MSAAARFLRDAARALTQAADALEHEAPQPDAVAFTSQALPPHTSRRAFNEKCRSGHVRGARKLGRVWSCTRDAWLAPAKPAVPRLRLVRSEPTDEELADLALRGGRP